jgi:hypothetical protein
LPGTHTAHSSNLRSDDRFLSYVELVWIFVGLVVFFDGSSSWGGGSHFSVHSIFVPESIPSVTVFQHSNQSVIH